MGRARSHIHQPNRRLSVLSNRVRLLQAYRPKHRSPATRFHDLRHTFAVASIKSGDDIKTVQENLGHATAAFTLDVYGHVTKQMKRDSAQRMEQFIQAVSAG